MWMRGNKAHLGVRARETAVVSGGGMGWVLVVITVAHCRPPTGWSPEIAWRAMIGYPSVESFDFTVAPELKPGVVQVGVG